MKNTLEVGSSYFFLLPLTTWHNHCFFSGFQSGLTTSFPFHTSPLLWKNNSNYASSIPETILRIFSSVCTLSPGVFRKMVPYNLCCALYRWKIQCMIGIPITLTFLAKATAIGIPTPSRLTQSFLLRQQSFCKATYFLLLFLSIHL